MAAPRIGDILRRSRLRDRMAMIFKLFSILGTRTWSYLDDYLISPLAKPAFILGLIYAIINWKVIPFAWHIRVFNGYYLHYVPAAHLPPLPPIFTASKPSSSSPASASGSSSQSISTAGNNSPKATPTIFLPTLYKTSCPPGEIDFSFHKSNSTYLTDLDIARGYHLYTVFRRGFYLWSRPPQSGDTKRTRSPLMPMLGGTTCTFKKEIPPLAKVEIWTRVLGWDGKWVFLVSHFVKPRAGSDGTSKKEKKMGDDAGDSVYATCISKVVFKEGRKTIAPEEFFRLCGLLGEPGQHGRGHGGGLEDWNWKEIDAEIERKRAEGIKLAEHVAALDEGHSLFGVKGEEKILGVY